jgi:hypothetical protein
MTWIMEMVISTVLGALATLLQAIPVPQWLQDAPNVLANVPSGVVWFFQILQLPQGMAIILGALTLRFLIRRIPFIG